MTVATTLPARAPRAQAPVPVQPAPRITTLPPQRALALPLLFTLGLAAFVLLPLVRQNPRLLWSLLGTAAVLFAWNGVLLASALRDGRTLAVEVALRKQHYLQACAQGSVLLYWGWYWREVYAAAPLIVAQLVFAYAFDMLLAWSRRDTYTFGFGPFPVIFSINLFLWFRHDWFYLQFLMVAVGFTAKELIRWNKDGRRAHVFNPSSFPLAVFSIALILTGTTTMTWGEEIARTQFQPPNIYLMLFLVGLPGQFFFGVTSMTLSAVATMYGFGLLYFAATGTYYFLDSYIPIAVFLGMHLLFTDPSTSPRTELGRIAFGVLYALSTIALYAVLDRAGLPTFYDKLLPVPILNLTIRLIDRAARSNALKSFDPALLGRALTPPRRNLAYMCIWAVVFVVMSAAQGVGDTHPGQALPFWQQACRQGLRDACPNVTLIESAACSAGSNWACSALRVGPAAQPGDPQLADYAILLQNGKGSLGNLTPLEVWSRACDQGWMAGCEGAGHVYANGEGMPRDPVRAAVELDKACEGGRPVACSNLGFLYRQGDGVVRDPARALGYLKKACDLGMPDACGWLEAERQHLGITR